MDLVNSCKMRDFHHGTVRRIAKDAYFMVENVVDGQRQEATKRLIKGRCGGTWF